MNHIYRLLSITLFLCTSLNAQVSQKVPEYSKAGFYEVPNSGREVFDFNVGWRFYKGAIDNAQSTDFDDANWKIVSTPHGLELNSTQASGSNNYQGEAWYRKHFTIPSSVEDKRLIVHFEAVMGKCKVWLNGELLTSHFGGFLPFSVDISNKIKKGQENILAVWADNSDDPTYPPGKPQKTMDFSYFGGVYRDVWLVATNDIYITNANNEDKVAGGGLFVHFDDLSKEKVTIAIDADLANNNLSEKKVIIQYTLKNAEGKTVSKSKIQTKLTNQNSQQISHKIKIDKPQLWSPQHPYLYNLEVKVLDKRNKPIDGIKQKVGIRKIEFKGKAGFYLNNEPYQGKLIGANRHQDYAYVGNALPNSGQWRDAKILKEAGCDIIRAAHYPADPAFMDACDELGLFFIVATPGWQFWNDKDPSFEKGVYQDIRNMVRRDRNHPSVLMWEPILNETYYPSYFAKKVHNIVHEEYPYQGAYTACDSHARGQEYFDIVYSHPFKEAFYKNSVKNTPENNKFLRYEYEKENRSIFTREWGDSVDDWNSHNSPSRVSRGWGEYAQLVQVNHYAKPPFVYTSWEALYNTPKQHVGGTLWHAFDHQRGYHPDPFYGGITDVFRQPKYSYQLFKSQRTPKKSEPMVYIAHEMTPFSQPDVTVFSNCDEVRLIIYEKDTLIQKIDRTIHKMPSPITVFKNVFDFADVKVLHRSGQKYKTSFIAEGLIDGKVVVTTKKMPALRPSKIKLELANQNIPLVANGSDFISIIASVVDKNGNIKRLNNDVLKFEITGEGTIIGDQNIFANPKKVEWGTAPVLVRSTTNTGTITVRASVLHEGINTPSAGKITFTSTPSTDKLLFSEVPSKTIVQQEDSINIKTTRGNSTELKLKRKIKLLEKELNKLKLKEVEKQQQEFEGVNKKKKN